MNFADIEISKKIELVRTTVLDEYHKRKHNIESFSFYDLTYSLYGPIGSISGTTVLDIYNGKSCGYVGESRGYDYFDPVVEYCCTLLTDGSIYEGLILKTDLDKTLVYIDGSLVGEIIRCFRLKTGCDYELMFKGRLWGKVINNASHLFGLIKSEQMITWNSLKIHLYDGRIIPVYINVSAAKSLCALLRGPIWLLALAPLWAKKKRFPSDMVVPVKKEFFKDNDEVRFYFIINVIFRLLLTSIFKQDTGASC